MLVPTLGVGELVFRSAVVFLFVFVLLRLLGKKHVGEMSPFDLVILLILSESVQNALVGDDKSLTAGLVVAGTLFCISQFIGYMTWKNKKAERFLDGAASVIVRNGTANKEAMEREQITRAELLEALRKKGCTSLSRVRFAVLENDGGISVGFRRRKTIRKERRRATMVFETVPGAATSPSTQAPDG